MTNYKQIALVTFLALAGDAAAFQASPATSRTATSTTTQLQALPPMIISGAIKKYQAKQEGKKMPLASREEAKQESPGLRVGSKVWKWPPIWPYDREFFMPNEDIPSQNMGMNDMASMLSGVQQPPEVAAAEAAKKAEEAEKVMVKLDVMDYWGKEKADVKTEMDEEAIEKIKSHYAFYLKDDISILELGAAENSYLPDSIKTSRHVGIGLNKAQMDSNPAISESMVVDLNKVLEDRDVDDDEFRKLAADPFDAVIMANTVEFLTSPREVLRSAWAMLKPGGQMFIVFSGKDNPTTQTFERASTKIWRDYNDDQHMWICGSIFEFSAGEGWENLRGFDISPESARDMTADENAFEKLMNRGKKNNLFVVQAVKAIQDEALNMDDLEKSINSRMWMMPVVEPRDKNLVVPRIVRCIEETEGETQKQIIESVDKNLALLPNVFQTLIKMDQFAFTFSMQAQLATDLITNPDFEANDEQLLALKQGLGLRKPSKDFWEPLGTYTSNLEIEDKINLLGYIVPCFGSNDKAQEACLQDFAAGLKPTIALVRSKCPDLGDADIQLIATEFLAAEILKPSSKTSREDFAKWIATMEDTELKAPLVARQALRRKSQEGLASFKTEQMEAKEELEKQKKRYQEVVRQARESRTMVISGRTGKFEEYKA